MASEIEELKKISSDLAEIKRLIEKLIAIQLYSNGVTQEEIAENLGISTGKTSGLVKGMKIRKDT